MWTVWIGGKMFEKGWNRTTLLYVIGMVFSGPIILVIVVVIAFAVSSNPIQAHDMDDGVTCYTYKRGIDCLELGR